ncbi:MAG: aspartate-semialdehyde dehydrogenase [Pseudomonadota bacterium]|nr:aspartate-semialdehyde dehydrogenase [Pseudomonadota bacterium]MEC9459256.1 aspartate-semialdehyde dehydrogenase [Pseudomonadota bacterium]
MGLRVAVVGATGNVGREMLSILDERKFPVDEIFALASSKSKGNTVEFGKKEIIVEDLREFDFSKADIALFSAGGKISSEYAPKAADKGCVVIDNSSRFRMDEDIPLIVPEVNADQIPEYKKRKIIANPNCSTIQMVVALKPLYDLSKIKRVVVSSYQSTSGAGKEAMEELFEQTKGIFSNSPVDPNIFQKQISFNVIPQIGPIGSSGYTEEEEKMINETKKILDPNINVSATCVRVPTFIGHAESVNIEFEEYVSSEEAVKALSDAPGCNVESVGSDEYITPVDCVGDDATFISRVRNDDSIQNGLNLWVVSDNLRKGAALNTIQIAEILYSNYLS